MKINMFAAARRLLISGLALAVLAVGANAVLSARSLEFTRKVLSHENAIGGLATQCERPNWSEPVIVRTETTGQTTITYRVCFITPTEGGKQFIAFGNERFTMDQASQLAYSRQLTTEEVERARSVAHDQRVEAAKSAFILLAMVAVALVLVSLAIGWVVRGMLGIPYGSDRRPPADA